MVRAHAHKAAVQGFLGGLCEGLRGLCEGRGGLCEGRGGLCDGRDGLCKGRGGQCEGRGGWLTAPASCSFACSVCVADVTVAELTTPGAVVVVIDPRRAVVTELRTFANPENVGGGVPASSDQTPAAYLRALAARERDYARSVTATAAAQSPGIESAPASASSVLLSVASESATSVDDARTVERRLPHLVVLLTAAPTRDVYVCVDATPCLLRTL